MTDEPESREEAFLGRWERRDIAKAAIGVGSVSAAAGLLTPLTGLTKAPERGGPGQLYVDGTFLVDEFGNRVAEDALENGQRMTVFPETNPDSGDAPTLLFRFEEDTYAEPTNLAFTAGGYAAYSKVCTHAGCMVSGQEDDKLVCPCHFAEYDPTRGAQVVGGPAPRPLPQLPITLSSDGYLMATGEFEGPIGPGGE